MICGMTYINRILLAVRVARLFVADFMSCHQTALMSCRLTAKLVGIGIIGVCRPESERHFPYPTVIPSISCSTTYLTM